MILLKLFGHSPSRMWREFGKREIAVFKKGFEELLAILEKEKKNGRFRERNR